MSGSWQRVTLATLCGRCNREIAKGEPVLVSQFMYHGGRPIRRVRCDRCEGPAPPDLPPLVEVSNTIGVTRMKRFAPLLPFDLARDWKHRATGDREPGEEG